MPKHRYSSTQVQLPSTLAAAVRAMAARIPDADLAEDGRESVPHVTARYGLQVDDPVAVRPIVAGFSPITLTLGRTSVFPATPDRPSDVVKLDVSSPGIRRLNAALAALPHADTHQGYTPHVTLAYVLPGRGTRYAGLADLAGRSATVDSVRFSDRDSTPTDLPMTTTATPSTDRTYDPATSTWSFSRSAGGDKPAVGGHWVTIDHHPVFIGGGVGHVPARVKHAHGTRFTRAEIERSMIEHYHATGGGWRAEHDRELADTSPGGHAWTFKGKLPAEVKEHLAGRPALRKLFRVSKDAGGGADAFAALGDRYLDLAELAAGSPARLAAEHAAKSGDPELEYLAKVHANLPRGGKDRADLGKLDPAGLRVGDRFTVNGVSHRVAEDADGYRVLRHGTDYEVPVDALAAVPHDKGSFRAGRAAGAGRGGMPPKPADDIPFSRSASRTFDPSQGYWRTVHGAKVHFDGAGRADQGPRAAVESVAGRPRDRGLFE
ncbi:MAG: hypothetical protein JWO31_80, partial [Phycisphaerales bacterium]|nr:hypothetical protein [Phycisphaerales bacterium]